MGWPQCNTTEEDMLITEEAIWHDYTFHHLGLWLSAVFSIIAIAVSFFLIFMHATHYAKPFQQRHIIRILFMVPVYAAVSFLSFYYYNHSVYFEVLRDCYEAFAIASFFSLLCSYAAADLHQQKIYFRSITPKNWVWPMKYFQKCTGGAEKGWLRKPRSGLTWFNVIWVSIFQYCFIRVFCTIVAVVTQAFDRYCLESLNPAFSHIWVMLIEAVAVTIAMYCLIQFYIQLRMDIQQYGPLLKVAAIKLVIFLSFWQTILISFLTSSGAVKPSNTIQTPDLKVGIPAMLLCIEMAFFAILHLWAFSWKPYTMDSPSFIDKPVPGEDAGSRSYKGGFLGLKAIWDAFNPWDMVKATGRAAKWLMRDRKHRHKDTSYDLSRKTTTDDYNAEGQKLTNLNGSTAYGGGSAPQRFANGDVDEGQNLLSHSQPMPMSRPAVTRIDSDRIDGEGRNDYYDPSDIGLATSSYNDNRYQPHHPQQQNYHPQQQYHPNGGQETGIAPAPYPDQLGEQSGQVRRDNRVSMPFIPGPPLPGSSDPRHKDGSGGGGPGGFV